MIFEGKVLSEISNDEIVAVVDEHLSEDQNLEFKLTVNHKESVDRFETLRDIASLANAGGGYLIVGIRDDGKGKAQTFETVESADSILKSIRSLCLDYISERIDGLEMEKRNIDKKEIIIIRIPASNKIPHMVTFENNTHFCTRYSDGKREMTVSEIRSAFINDVFGKRLALIEDGIKNIIGKQQVGATHEVVAMIEKGEVSVLTLPDGNIVANTMQEFFRNRIGDKPFFRVSITPKNTRRDFIDVDSQDLMNVFRQPPNQRHYGWNMNNFYSQVRRFTEGISRGEVQDRMLILFENGHMEFYAVLDTNFCWNQSEEEFKKRPRLYPYPLIEYPSSFLSLYKNLIKFVSYNSTFIVSMQFFNLKGYVLNPYSPQSFGFMTSSSQQFADKDLLVPPLEVDYNFNPDKTAYQLLRYVYAAFGYSSDAIPFYKADTEAFEMG